MDEQENESRKLGKSGSEAIYRHIKENAMKSSIRDQAEGVFHEVKGKVKEVAGKLSDNPKLKIEGTVEKMSAKSSQRLARSRRFWESSQSGVTW